MYTRLNHLNICLSYPAAREFMRKISKLFTSPIQQWISNGKRFCFVGDNLDRTIGVRDERSDHHSHLQHMYSILAMENRVATSHLTHTGTTSTVDITATAYFPSKQDIFSVKSNLIVLIERMLVKHIPALSFLSSVVCHHIAHKQCPKNL